MSSYYCENFQPENVALHDGREVQIRAVCKEDGELEKQLFEGLSPELRRDRFLGGNHKVSEKLLALLTDNDHNLHEALIAIADPDTDPRAVGVAHYACDASGHACECAVVVADDWQHVGLGRLLLQSLTEIAQGHGLDEIYSVESAENHHGERLARAMGFQAHADPHDYTLLTYTKYLHPDYLVSREAATGVGRGQARH
ncbi:GNAT family N-acetyltransferase [Microbulbifer yueqingensis]|uniref:Acetyltransferase (GNAT) family protein n=1 Tax=Microbulbifer yueqingensis TaxID=658219 RepID=A0A1G8Y9B0_9GAMM|nr:GNAT family N-acetyltransferase [Microbulbifer yueqingensis]SDJ99418.1 Acetyltransferase (GNAT) family protein [Microbulbifer yueqingensis]